jgi:hypothetical protein
VIDIDPVRSDAQRRAHEGVPAMYLRSDSAAEGATEPGEREGEVVAAGQGEGEGCPLGTDTGGTLD